MASERTRYLFIAGCARSGTTLMLRQMATFAGLRAAPEESDYSRFQDLAHDAPWLCLKRRSTAFATLERLPPHIDLVYMVRHPFDVLTSRHRYDPIGGGAHGYYVSRKRWLDEFLALQALRAAQPTRDIHVVRYEDLVERPDDVQRSLADRFDLAVERPFSQNGRTFTTSIRKWRGDAEMRRYLLSLPPFFVQRLRDFGADFDYDVRFAALRRIKGAAMAVRDGGGDRD